MIPAMNAPRTLLDGLRFPEGPRWHEGALWFSDMHARQVMKLHLDGRTEVVAEVPNDPSGLGWLPDGRLLVVSMQDRRLLRLDPDGLHEVADLSACAPFHCNDMVVDAQGRAYVGNFGFDLHAGGKPSATNLALVRPDGETLVVADELLFPNGTVITPDGGTLIVGESFGARLRPSRSPPMARSRSGASGPSSRRPYPTASASMPRAASGWRRRSAPKCCACARGE
jgi:sugar lactone lactonase YvrE